MAIREAGEVIMLDVLGEEDSAVFHTTTASVAGSSTISYVSLRNRGVTAAVSVDSSPPESRPWEELGAKIRF